MKKTTQSTLDCGHEPDKGHPAQIGNKTVQGWQFVLTEDGRKICHACAAKIILDCGHTPSPHEPFTTGYGVTQDGKKRCYACCAEDDKAQMVKDGKTVLYLVERQDGTGKRYEVTNWPGTLRFPVYGMSAGRHNLAGKRYDFRFKGPDGKPWRGVQYGDENQLAHCKKLKG